jgi:hypothetical protein
VNRDQKACGYTAADTQHGLVSREVCIQVRVFSNVITLMFWLFIICAVNMLLALFIFSPQHVL